MYHESDCLTCMLRIGLWKHGIDPQEQPCQVLWDSGCCSNAVLDFLFADHSMQVRHIIAGTAARTMAQCFIHPIDTVKTRLQAGL